ncbi:MAG: hypothetical protein ABSG65_19555 [Bryobacteraceae bacterium]
MTPERLAALEASKAFESLATSKKTGALKEIEAGAARQPAVLAMLRSLPPRAFWKNRAEFLADIEPFATHGSTKARPRSATKSLSRATSTNTHRHGTKNQKLRNSADEESTIYEQFLERRLLCVLGSPLLDMYAITVHT